MSRRFDYPFAAIVGQDQLTTALLLNALAPEIGGVLIRGEKGTAKSTAARALAALLPLVRVVADCPFRCDPEAPWTECPHCRETPQRAARDMPAPFVDLPLGATEDRVLGTLDFERALREGRRAVQPGLLASAHRGILYIDEVNLLADHLVDCLLDAAAMGTNVVQREGVAVAHPARFILIGTMNPEEGELRPQLLDRFGLMVEIMGPRDPVIRAEIVRRRLDFEASPEEFAARWSQEQEALRERIVHARRRWPTVVCDDALLAQISELCCRCEVEGLRADIALQKTARALAAWEGAERVSAEHVRTAAQWVLPHRRRRRPFEGPGLERPPFPDLLGHSPPAAADAGETLEPNRIENPANGDRVFAPAPSPLLPSWQVASPDPPNGITRGSRNQVSNRERGAYVRATPDPSPPRLALDATIRAAVQRAAGAGTALQVKKEDLHRKEFVARTGTLIVFVVDASGSMAARRRMEAVKSAVLGLLQDAFHRRDQVAVIAFRGPEAELVLPPTKAIDAAERALRELPTGGRTPLAHALILAREVIVGTRRTETPRFLVAVLSDGKANVGLPGTTNDPWQQALEAAQTLAAERVPVLLLDTETGFVRLGRARELAAALQADYLSLDELSAGAAARKFER
jgi:magnesium chelatase subunit D